MGHWYDKYGNPQHFTNGRDSTLRDARKFGWFPSVTEIINTLDKPALTNWKLKQVTQACYENDSPAGLHFPDPKDYHKEMLSRAFAESTGQRDRGSEIHDAIESYFNRDQWQGITSEITEIAAVAALKIIDYCDCDADTFIAEQTVVGDGYGGMVDLHNDIFLIDWKTKDIEDGKRMAYPEQSMQLAAYDKALPSVPVNRRLINVFIDRTEPGKVVIHEWKPEEIQIAWQKFQLLVKYWQLSKNYFPHEFLSDN